MAKQVTVKELQKDLNDIRNRVGALLGIQTLEHFDSNHLKGNPTQISAEKLEIIKQLNSKIETLTEKLNSFAETTGKTKGAFEQYKETIGGL